MKKLLATLLVSVLMTTSTGCVSFVTSGLNGNNTHAGDFWYTKRTYFLLWPFPISDTVWYCPAPQAPGPATCRQATME